MDATQKVIKAMSPQLIWLVRIVTACQAIMLLLSLIFCLVKGPQNPSFFLLAGNIVITSVIMTTMTCWFARGVLSPDKYWLLVFIAGVVMWQCIATDIYVFQLPVASAIVGNDTISNYTTSEHQTTLSSYFNATSSLPAGLL